MFISVVIPLWTYAALQETQTTPQPGNGGTDKTVVSPQSPNNDEKNLANEPLPRGQLLYENHCQSCHESIVHIREDHKAKNFADVQYWVGRWAQEVETKWSADEIDAVVQYLNDTFYHY